MTSAQHSSESAEHYTPPEIVERARETLGRIDFDPFSCETANRIVRAERYLSTEQGHDGYKSRWDGEAFFVNPPGGILDKSTHGEIIDFAGTRSKAGAAWALTAHEIETTPYRTKSAVFVGFNIEILRVGQSAKRPPSFFPHCIPSSRVCYVDGETGRLGRSPPHSSVIICATYDAEIVKHFIVAFRDLGCIVLPGLFDQQRRG